MFNDVLRNLRKEKHLTQSELATALNISRSAISMYENGEREPDLDTLEAIADYFNVDMNQLTGQERYLSKNSVAYRIQAIMTYQNVSLDELAARLDVDKDSLYDFIYKTPDSEFDGDPRIYGIAEALGVQNVDAFLGCDLFTDDSFENYINFLFYKIDKNLPLTAQESNVVLDYLNGIYDDCENISVIDNIIPLPKTKKVPLIGAIACGEPILAVENIDSYINMAEDINADFALKCKGDSMINARIFDGDYVYIRTQEDVDDGEIAAVLIGDEATLKRVHKYPGKLVLSPCNPMYNDLIYQNEQLNEIRILGKAVAFLSAVR